MFSETGIRLIMNVDVKIIWTVGIALMTASAWLVRSFTRNNEQHKVFEKSLSTIVQDVKQGFQEMNLKIDTKIDNLEAKIDRKIDSKIDKLEQRFEQKFEKIDQRFEKIDQRFEKIDQRFEKIDQRFSNFDIRFEKFDARLGLVEHSIRNVVGELSELKVRVTHAERMGDLAVQQNSPLGLSPYGEEIEKKLNLKARVDQNWDAIYKNLKENLTSQHPYDVQEYCKRLAIIDLDTLLKEEDLNQIKDDVYKEGKSLFTYSEVLGILIRDKYLEVENIPLPK